MHRTNTPASVAATGAVQIDAGEGVTFSVPTGGVDLGTATFDTGLLNINDLATTRTAGDIYLRRSGVLVFLQVLGLVCSDQAHGFTAFTLPAGFRSGLNVYDPTPLHVVEAATPAGQIMRTGVGSNGGIRFFGMSDTTPLYFTTTYMTNDPLPATLPGSAA